MKPRILAIKVARALRERGVAAAIAHALGPQGLGILFGRTGKQQDAFDLKYGTDTGRIVAQWMLDVDSPNAAFGLRYQASEEREVQDALTFLGADIRNFTFLDLGCGKGRTLLIAAKLECRQVIGVEFSQELAAIARKNLSIMGIANGSIVEADAADYRFPDCDDLVIYFYNPFLDKVMHKVVSNLRQSRAKNLFIIYKVPDCAQLFDDCEFLTPLGSPPGHSHIRIWKRSAEA